MHTFFKLFTITSVCSLFLAACAPSPLSQSRPTIVPIASIAPTSAPTSAPLTITLKPLKGSGESGTAVFTDLGGGKTNITLTVTGKMSQTTQIAAIRTGTCTKSGNILFPLSALTHGSSVTTVSASLNSIKAIGQLHVGTDLTCGML